MVILGGLELVAAGYLIHKHGKNKKERRRIEEERIALEEEEQEYRRRHRSRGRRSPSSDRGDYKGRVQSQDRIHSYPKKYRRDSKPLSQSVGPSRYDANYPPPPPAQAATYRPAPPQAPPQDIKYGWRDDDEPVAAQAQGQQGDPPTGWPAHWAQTQRPEYISREGYERSSRGRPETRYPQQAFNGVSRRNNGEPGGRGQERVASWSPPPPLYR